MIYRVESRTGYPASKELEIGQILTGGGIFLECFPRDQENALSPFKRAPHQNLGYVIYGYIILERDRVVLAKNHPITKAMMANVPPNFRPKSTEGFVGRIAQITKTRIEKEGGLKVLLSAEKQEYVCTLIPKV